METIEDIVRKMRTLGRLDEKSTDRIPRSLQALGLRIYADRIEKAAAALESEKRYEYAEQYFDSSISSRHELSEEDVRLYASNGSTVVRRLVGEWEPVPRRCGE